MKEKLEFRKISQKLIDEINNIKGELRAEIILLQAHVEFMVDEILEILIETNRFRGNGMQLEKKLSFLKKLGWIEPDFARDIQKLANIRGFIAHRINICDDRTRKDIREKFSQITLLKKADKSVFQENESIQEQIKTIAKIYFAVLGMVYEKVYHFKSTNSIQNASKEFDSFQFLKQGNDIIISHNSID